VPFGYLAHREPNPSERAASIISMAKSRSTGQPGRSEPSFSDIAKTR
jgi:hypothetical protein